MTNKKIWLVIESEKEKFEIEMYYRTCVKQI